MAQGFELFMEEAPEVAKAYGGMVMQLAQTSALDHKTQELAYLAAVSYTHLRVLCMGLNGRARLNGGIRAGREIFDWIRAF